VHTKVVDIGAMYLQALQRVNNSHVVPNGEVVEEKSNEIKGD
jgi:hypothetical protein